LDTPSGPRAGKLRSSSRSGRTIAELRRPGVTLALLWQEYKAAQPHGFQYSWFCDHYRAWQGKLDVVMRQEHRVGEKLFVDTPARRCR